MMKIRESKIMDQKGFTLVEIIIVIALIAVGLSLAGYGLGVVYAANIDGAANDLAQELRNIRYRTTAEANAEYQIHMSYNITDKQYYYEVYRKEKGVVGLGDRISKKEFSNVLRFEVERDNGVSKTWEELKDFSNVTFRFDPSTGSIMLKDFSGADVDYMVSDITVGQYGRIRISSNYHSDIRILELIGYTGRVNLNEN
ncbi:MAG: prepilin-type N-terminal cleavage/methylation domain-containing protein [Vallitaleaceae bacterium]|nr:prepilin-type N-terminal cleavage/methylation domain-containing protein [Vallitaleaceae bacterium]